MKSIFKWIARLGKRHKLLTILLILLAIAGLGSYLYYQIYGVTGALFNAPRTTEQRLSSLETWRISLREEIDKEIQTQLPKNTITDVEFQSLAQQVSQIQGEVANVSKASELIQRNLPVWLLAYGQLSIALRTSAPFTVQYQTLLLSSQGNPEIIASITPLAPYANTGVATEQSLAIEFSALTTQILRDTAGNNNTWIGKIQRLLANLLLIRRVDLSNSDTNSTEYLLEKAQELINANDWQNAIITLEAIMVSNIALQTFLAKAKARQQVNAIMTGMDNKIITLALLGAGKR